MATSYSNPGGSGNRTATNVVTLTGQNFGGSGIINPANFVDGAFTANSTDAGWIQPTFANNGQRFVFDFGVGESKIIDEIKWYQSDTTNHGTYQVQGSNDGSAWTNIGSEFSLGGVTTQTITAISGNTTGYRYYGLYAKPGGGNTSSVPYMIEVEFKIDEAAPPPLALTASLLDEALFEDEISFDPIAPIDPLILDDNLFFDEAALVATTNLPLVLSASMIDEALFDTLFELPPIRVPGQMVVIITGSAS